jgi:hypothetical protein
MSSLTKPTLVGPDNAGNDTDYAAWVKVGLLFDAANAGQLQGFKNRIINGDFNVWQRGTSFVSAVNVAYHADRWLYSKSGAMVHDISRSTDVPTVAQAGRLFIYSLLVDCTTADASIAATDYADIQQVIEGFNWAELAQRACVLSFWVKATKTGIYTIALRNSGSDRSYAAEYTVNASDTWEFKTVSIAASPSAGTWDYTNGAGVKVSFILAVGSTYQTPAGAWATGNYLGTANQVNACDSTANNYRLCGVQLEPGEAATAFERRPFATELALCLRYYQKSFPYATAPAQNAGLTGAMVWPAEGASTNHRVALRPQPPMRASPTRTYFNPSAANAQARDADAAADCTGTATSGIVASGENGGALFFTTPAGSAVGNAIAIHYTLESEL